MADEKQKTYNEYVEEAYELFIKNAAEVEPTSGDKAIEAYFERSASEELKAKVQVAGKTAADAWAFVTAIARAHRLDHIDPANVYAIAMHYFEDVPKEAPKNKPQSAPKPEKAKTGEDKPKRTKAAQGAKKAKPEKKSKKKAKPKDRQTFFFDLLEEKGGTENVEPSGN